MRPGPGMILACAIHLACAVQAAAAGDSVELLRRIRQHMSDNLAHLPNYTCLETIERAMRPVKSRDFTLSDRLRLEVAYVGQDELYSWPGGEKFEDKPLPDMVGDAGTISTGSFALHANAVFRTNGPVFSWVGEAERNRRKTVRWDFRVSKEKSHYAIRTGSEYVVVAYHGLIEADEESLALLRLEVDADDLPPEMRLRRVNEVIEYRQIRMGDSDFLLPVTSDLLVVDTTGFEKRNVTRFERCRQYMGASTVRFDVSESDAAGTLAAAPIELPAGLSVDSALRDKIDWASAARGDRVYATVTADV